MKPAFILFAAAIAACPFVSRADSNSSVVTREYPVAAHGALLVDINRANITIEPSDTQMVRIIAREHCAVPGSLTSPTLDVSVAHSSTHIQISAEDNSPESTTLRAELTIQVPRGFNVRVRDGEGNVRVGNMSGLVDATTEFGTVRMSRATQTAENKISYVAANR
jgi:hypothetical protein